MKKRDILPYLNDAILALTQMSADAAKLEIMDNDQASRRIKRALVDFKKGELDRFTKIILGVRTEINMIPPKKRLKGGPLNLIESDDSHENF
jgi:hypothetical protein